jgi:signal transduction histidine kinase
VTRLRSTNISANLVRIALALSIAFILTRFQFDYIEALFYDARVRLTPTPPPSGHIKIISIDSHSVEQLGHVPNASDHLKVLKQLKRAEPSAVIYFIQPSDIVGSMGELKAVADLAESFEDFYVALPDVAIKGESEAIRLPSPFENTLIGFAPSPKDGNIFAKDGVTRRLMTSYQQQPLLHTILAQKFNPLIADEQSIRGLFEYLNSSQAYITTRPSHTYQTTSFVDIEQQRIPLQSMRGKIILVGRDIQTTSKDYVLTPHSRSIVAMTTVEMQANILDTLILNSAPIRAPEWINFVLTALISILTVYIVLSVNPTSGLLILGATLLSFCAFAYGLFGLAGLWIAMAHPFLAVFISYYFFIPYRLIIENQRSWEYYQKNRLLTQVEELKTNFLSMMSHDLKTPLARIQGMANVVLNDKNPLSPIQKDALTTLSRSSEELLEFISSILNLGRIESKAIHLHLTSRDPNNLLLQIIEKYQYLAKSKSIEVTTELEPLFSIKMDADLMQQVFSNLMENAIKYSPEGSRILVSTEENKNHISIQIADQGQGIPEEDLPQLFTKFYRAKNAKFSTIKGSGLGLYLAKYFVELHKGKISVDSRLGEGSTFTVELPTNLQETRL